MKDMEGKNRTRGTWREGFVTKDYKKRQLRKETRSNASLTSKKQNKTGKEII